MKIMITYPHGIGDCILATPMLKALKNEGYYIGFIMLKRFETSELFRHCPYIDELLYCEDPWNDFISPSVGFKRVYDIGEEYTINLAYDKHIFINHSSDNSKILDNMSISNMISTDLHTEVFISDNDINTAQSFLSSYNIKDFAFIHGHSPSLPLKDFPPGYIENNIKRRHNVDYIEVGKTFNTLDFNINVQFEIMRRSSYLYLIDSAFYHAACALDKKINLAYFNRGEVVYNRVKPLHKIDENVVYKL